jgi:hypothetical protein
VTGILVLGGSCGAVVVIVDLRGILEVGALEAWFADVLHGVFKLRRLNLCTVTKFSRYIFTSKTEGNLFYFYSSVQFVFLLYWVFLLYFRVKPIIQAQ